MSLSASAIVVIAFTSAKELFPVEIAGTSVGLVNLFPFLGGAVMQPVLGIILESYGQGPDGYSAEAYSQAFFGLLLRRRGGLDRLPVRQRHPSPTTKIQLLIYFQVHGQTASKGAPGGRPVGAGAAGAIYIVKPLVE